MDSGLAFWRDRSGRRDGNDSDDNTRSPSPSPSSGVDGGSIKDSPMQIDVLAGDNSLGTFICIL